MLKKQAFLKKAHFFEKSMLFWAWLFQKSMTENGKPFWKKHASFEISVLFSKKACFFQRSKLFSKMHAFFSVSLMAKTKTCRFYFAKPSKWNYWLLPVGIHKGSQCKSGVTSLYFTVKCCRHNFCYWAKNVHNMIACHKLMKIILAIISF